MRFGLFASVLFHLCLAGGVVLWGSDWTSKREFVVEPSIPVELISEATLAEITNIPAAVEEADIAPAPQPEPDIPDDPVPVIEEPVASPVEEVAPVAPPPPQKEEVEEPEPAKPEPKPEPKKDLEPPKPKPKPTEKPKPEPKPKPAGFDLDALEAEAKAAKKDQAPAERTPSQTAGVQGGTSAGGELTATETALVRAAMASCWTPLDGAPNPETLVVVMNFKLNRDGTLQGRPKVENAGQIALSGNRYWKVAERNAIQAISECAPYDFLPPERYDIWKEFYFTFIPPSQ